jgi:hypothetical protein
MVGGVLMLQRTENFISQGYALLIGEPGKIWNLSGAHE